MAENDDGFRILSPVCGEVTAADDGFVTVRSTRGGEPVGLPPVESPVVSLSYEDVSERLKQAGVVGAMSGVPGLSKAGAREGEGQAHRHQLSGKRPLFRAHLAAGHRQRGGDRQRREDSDARRLRQALGHRHRGKPHRGHPRAAERRIRQNACQHRAVQAEISRRQRAADRQRHLRARGAQRPHAGGIGLSGAVGRDAAERLQRLRLRHAADAQGRHRLGQRGQQKKDSARAQRHVGGRNLRQLRRLRRAARAR